MNKKQFIFDLRVYEKRANEFEGESKKKTQRRRILSINISIDSLQLIEIERTFAHRFSPSISFNSLDKRKQTNERLKTISIAAKLAIESMKL